MEGTKDARLKEILRCAVTHLHAFVSEVQLTEREYQKVCAVIARAGQLTNAHHNEVVLAGGSLGVSALVCLLNNGVEISPGDMITTANMLGPFWRDDAPATKNGETIARGPTLGDPVFVRAWVKDLGGNPVDGARVDVWHTSAQGFYENQDPSQADMNLRGQFVTGSDGLIAFKSVKPGGYPVPVNGPVGDLLRAQGRHNMRPAHIHFLIHKAGFKTQFSQIYSSDDPYLDSDVQFGVTYSLIGVYEKRTGLAPDQTEHEVWYSLERTFTIEPGKSELPRAPIQGKNTGTLPEQVILKRLTN